MSEKKQKGWLKSLGKDGDDLDDFDDLEELGEGVAESDDFDQPKNRSLLWLLGVITATLAVGILMVNWWISLEPDEFDIEKVAMESASLTNPDKLPKGYVFASTLAKIGDTLLTKNAGYITNDVAPPMIFLDNMPSWEYGALRMLRDGAQGLRNHLARAQSQSKEDGNLAQAEPHFNYDNNSWQLPSSESEFKKGVKAMERYMKSLQNKRGSGFYSRADNLRAYLEVIEKRLGGLAHQLSASSNQVVNTKITRSRGISKATEQTPWLEVDDVFYEARGACWALLHIFKAIEYDFHDTLIRKQGEETMHAIIEELKNTQVGILSPVVLNGSGFGLSANYSITMATYIARAASATMDLRERMTRG